MEKVFVALSGGVDSSVAAALLKSAAKPHEFEKLMGRPIGASSSGFSPAPKGLRGFDVAGIHLKMWSPQDSSRLPASRYQLNAVCEQQYQDRLDAARVAATLGIPFQTWDVSEDYRQAVVDYMIREYAAGRTPNPDVMCNREIKFGVFLKKAREAGADYVATGHYVRLRRPDQTDKIGENDQLDRAKRFTKRGDSSSLLLQAIDQNKDQSYFLWTLTQEQLRHCIFPIGEYTKPEVRELARKYDLPTAEKPDSQGICFIGEIDVRDFLKQYIPEREGAVITTSGKIVGGHEGVEFYTIGQRQGIGIGGGIPYYVAEKDTKTNTLTVSEGPYDERLFKKELVATNVGWISGTAPEFPLECEARIRYRQPLQSCWIEEQNYADNTQINAENFSAKISVKSAPIRVIFDEPQRAITPGQSIVFYRGGEMLGGAIIA